MKRETAVSRGERKVSGNNYRKLKICNPIYWDHHRGGWMDVLRLMADRLHAPDGVRFISAVENLFKPSYGVGSGPIRDPWVGFVHKIPHFSLPNRQVKPYAHFLDLDHLTKLEEWKESLEHCLGLWTLTEYQRQFLLDKRLGISVERLFYPASQPLKLFSFDAFLRNRSKKLLFVGVYLRNFQAFYDLPVMGYEKILLVGSTWIEVVMNNLEVRKNSSVIALERASDMDYDDLLHNNLVFLNLFDAVAVTTVIECIARGTPILINRIGAVSEYLGSDYPLYYTSLEEAAEKARSLDLIHAATVFLANSAVKTKLTPEYFIEALQNTDIYQGLPIPQSEQVEI
jgi:hypothetical protein